MKKISSWLKWTWSGGPSPGLCHAIRTEVAPPVASVERSTFMSRPNGLIDSACSGLTMVACKGDVLAPFLLASFGLVNWRRDCCFMILPPLASVQSVTASIVPDRIDLNGDLKVLTIWRFTSVALSGQWDL